MISGHAKLYSRDYKVCCSFLQIYNEKIYDLLNHKESNSAKKGGPGLKVR